MDLLSTLKNTVSAKTVENLGTFLGESQANVSSGINLSLTTFLGGLLKYTSSDAETAKIINVLKEGGHTGELLNNLESFTANGEKSKLIITIGNNIVNHFFDNKSPIIEKIADLSGIKKTSSSSLCSFAAPIVLGLLGKKVKESHLDASGLRNLLLDNSKVISNNLPPSIAQMLNLKTDTVEIIHEVAKPHVEQEAEKVETIATSISNESRRVVVERKPSTFSWLSIIPWLVLGLASLFSIYYYLNVKNKPENNNEIASSIASDSIETLEPKDFLPDSNGTSTEITDKEEIRKVIEKPVTAGPATVETITEPVKTPKNEPLITPKVATKAAPVVKSSETTFSKPKFEKVNDDEVSSSIPSGWGGISGRIFQNNSAEVSNTSGLNSIVAKLGSGKRILIAPLSGSKSSLSEDRAYGLRDILIEKGVSENQIEIVRAVSGKDNNSIVYKIVN